MQASRARGEAIVVVVYRDVPSKLNSLNSGATAQRDTTNAEMIGAQLAQLNSPPPLLAVAKPVVLTEFAAPRVSQGFRLFCA